MSNISWTKTYEVPTKQGAFKLFVSEQPAVGYYASLFYCVKVGDRVFTAPNDPNAGYLDFRLEKRLATTEQEAFDEIMKWTAKEFEVKGKPRLVKDTSPD